MSRTAFVLFLAAVGLGVGLAVAVPTPEPPYRLSGPHTHDNLTIFLIHGADQLKDKTFLTLDEALEQKKVVVHETKNVNQLSIENVAADVEIFIASGDIVKGGEQDRVLAFDMVLPAKSGKLPISSFCVESGRWQQRGGEEASSFSSSKDQLSTKELKVAARSVGKQDEVWKKVAKCQTDLSRSVGSPVASPTSATSLQLTLEHKKLLEAVDVYFKKLSPIVAEHKDVIGFAFAINGQINSADIYASSSLFKKLWPKLLKATVVEAVADLKKDKPVPAVAESQVVAFLADAEKGKKTEKEVTKRLTQIQKESEKQLLFETVDQEQKGVKLRVNYIAK